MTITRKNIEQCAYALAYAYFIDNELVSARSWCEKLLRMNPDNLKATELHNQIREKQLQKHQSQTQALGVAATVGVGLGLLVAGLAAARRLKAAGYDVLVLDKGRRIGGRISTRRANGYLFNHGAQFITARSTEFSEICLSAEQTGKMALWDIGRKAPCFSGTPDMRGLAEMLGDGLNIIQQCEISDAI